MEAAGPSRKRRKGGIRQREAAVTQEVTRENALYTLSMSYPAQLHGQLMDFYAGEERELFNMTSKTHFCLRSLFLARYIHPCLVWCFKGEDTLQRVQKLWKSCLAGSKHWQVSKKAALKERHLLFLRHKVG